MDALEGRRIGLEQEFFLVDGRGSLSNEADPFLARCREVAEAKGRDPDAFLPECARCMVEINAPPAPTLEGLSREYLANVEVALEAARDAGLRLYPLATYPLPAKAALRDEPSYELQARAVGRERFENAGRCAGVHLHLEVAPGVVDPRVGVSYPSTAEERAELLALYNLATALDVALISLSRSCPFLDGSYTGAATRTATYRGHPTLFPEGLYSEMAPVGGLSPYAPSTEELVEHQFARLYSWLHALDAAGVERRLFFEGGGGLLSGSSWNPVRLNPVGTVELRGIDGNLPRDVLALGALLEAAASRVRQERLRVVPHEGLGGFEVSGDALHVPGFGELTGPLFSEAVFAGVEGPRITAYLDSVFAFCGTDGHAAREHFRDGDGYACTETRLLRRHGSRDGVSEEQGLALVLEVCDELEAQVAEMSVARPAGRPVEPVGP